MMLSLTMLNTQQIEDGIINCLYEAYINSITTRKIEDEEGGIHTYFGNAWDAFKSRLEISFYLINVYNSTELNELKFVFVSLEKRGLIEYKMNGDTEKRYKLTHSGIEYVKNKEEKEKIKEKARREKETYEMAQMLDKLLLLFYKNRSKKYYSIDELRRRIPALRLWPEEQLKGDLSILSGDIIEQKPGQQIQNYIIEKIVKNGVDHFRYNPLEIKNGKRLKKISDSLKSDSELKEIKIKERKDFQELHWFWIKFGGFISGLVIGIVATYVSGIGIEIWKSKHNKPIQVQTTSQRRPL